MALWVIVGFIVAVAVLGQLRQTIASRRSQKALASEDATALLRGSDGLNITEVDGHDLFVREIPLVPGVHSIAFQVSKHGGLVNIPARRYDIPKGLTFVEWSGATAADMVITLENEFSDEPVPALA